MDVSEAKQIVRTARKCPTQWFYIKTNEGKYIKKRLFISEKGVLCEYEKRSIDKTIPADTSYWLTLKPKYDSKTKLFRANVTRILSYLNESGLWKELVPEFERLDKESDTTIIDLYNRKYDLSDYLKAGNFKHITPSILYDLMRDMKFIRVVYWGKGNLHLQAELQEAIRQKKDYCKKWQMTYDNTIIYKAKSNQAWYNEEYRGSSSGHYHILIDSQHTIFRKDK